ncbi:MAG: ATP-binding cassette domain-containing protein [Rikenellaceae bacterium]|nr:ATP-binding cassette domain-containing protein [Rikenellaceae bacterium]
MNENFLELIDCQPRIKEFNFVEPVNWTLKYGEVWAVTGNNGSGKTILSGIINGKYPIKTGTINYDVLSESGMAPWQGIKTITFDSVYGLADFGNSYYQQRWHSTGNDDMPTVYELLLKERSNLDPDILSIFGIENFFDKKINFLSSGELRKFLLTKVLIENPKLLIIDNPYIGLDIESRKVLTEALRNLIYANKTQVIFIFSSSDNAPDFVTHILPLDKMKILPSLTYSQFFTQKNLNLNIAEKIETVHSHESIIDMKNISVKYGSKVIIDNFNWQICKGQKWALKGGNGKGKSTILSLINADHPQAYSNEIKIFGTRRGPGQSIWDVKKRIGYISPEMHTFYYQNIPAIDVVCSGLYDTIGNVKQYNKKEKTRSRKWFEKLEITHLKNRSFTKLSSGEQRLVLIARTFVKEPELLILDEPLHGLDTENKIKVRKVIEDYTSNSDVTLIYVSHYENEFPGTINHIKTL